jgi:hypothetical protein
MASWRSGWLQPGTISISFLLGGACFITAARPGPEEPSRYLVTLAEKFAVVTSYSERRMLRSRRNCRVPRRGRVAYYTGLRRQTA